MCNFTVVYFPISSLLTFIAEDRYSMSQFILSMQFNIIELVNQA